MSDPILPLLVGIVAALLVLGAVAGFVARRSRQAVGFVGAGLGGLGFLLTLISLLLGHEPDSVALPFGPPGLTLHLALDPLSEFFLLLAFLAGTAVIAFAAETESAAPASLAGVALCLAGVVLAVLAADGVTLAMGLFLAGGAIWASADIGQSRTLLLAVTGWAALATLGAIALSGFTFAAMRAQPVHANAAYVLALIGPAALAGLAPFHAWLIPAHRAAPARAAALLSGAMQPLAVYLLLRLTLDLSGPAPPLWWSVPLLAAGSANVLIGGWQAATEAEVDCCLVGLNLRQMGLAAIGMGLALLGRATDLPDLTTLALAAVSLLALSQAICGTLGQLAAGAIRVGAGSRRLTLLGGLIHPMPVAGACLAAAMHGLSALPAGVGFAGLWLLFQALVTAPRSGGLASSVGLAAIALALGLSAALAGAALVRVIGVALLGRPRGPRSAGAVDIVKPGRPGALGLVAAAALTGIFPGPVLWLAEAAIRQLSGAGLGDRAGLLGLAPSLAAPGYQVLPLVVLGAAICGGVIWMVRKKGGPEPRQSAAWNDGFAVPPAWLPFGDPLTQTAGAGLVPDLPRLRSYARTLKRWRKLPFTGLPMLLMAMALLLAALAWAGAA